MVGGLSYAAGWRTRMGCAVTIRLCKLCTVPVGKGKSFCQDCKKKKARSYYAQIKPEKLQYQAKKCEKCDKEFIPVARHQLCCSKRCKDYKNKLKYSLKAKEAVRVWRIKNREKLIAQRKASRQGKGVLMYRQWYAACTRGKKSYTGSLEEYVYYLERAEIRAHGVKKMAEAKSDAYRNAIESNPTYGMTDAQAYKYWYDHDPKFRAWERQRNQFRKWLKGYKRTNTLARTVGYDRDQLLKHLEMQFTPGMSWDNMGEWHIDHITPKNLFDPTCPKQVEACWSLSNLRPLWASDNLRRPKDGSDVLMQAIVYKEKGTPQQ